MGLFKRPIDQLLDGTFGLFLIAPPIALNGIDCRHRLHDFWLDRVTDLLALSLIDHLFNIFNMYLNRLIIQLLKRCLSQDGRDLIN